MYASLYIGKRVEWNDTREYQRPGQDLATQAIMQLAKEGKPASFESRITYFLPKEIDCMFPIQGTLGDFYWRNATTLCASHIGDREPTPFLKGVLLGKPSRRCDAIHKDKSYQPTTLEIRTINKRGTSYSFF